jgi:hypothetical protein
MRPVYILNTLLLLFIFGLAYNHFVERVERRAEAGGWTWAQVAVGTALTVLGTMHLIGWWNTLIVLAAFAASGLPMIVGAYSRHKQKLERLAARKAETDGRLKDLGEQ